jgi:Tol biopolymer transport system component
MLDLKRNVSTRFTFGQGWSEFPVFSPDGKEVIFASKRDQFWDLYRKPTNGAHEEELLLKSNENKRPLSWSSDGRFLIYGTSKTVTFTEEDLWLLPMQGEHKPQPFLNTRFDESNARFSPDGRWIAYQSNESGRYEVYVRDFDAKSGAAGAGKWMVSKDGGLLPLWRNDGKELVYVDQASRVMSVPVQPDPTFQAGTPQQLFQFPASANNYSAAPDLSRFIAPVPVDPKGPQAFNVILNWTSLLGGNRGR